MRLRLILPLLCVAATARAEPSPLGRWWTEDRSGVIEIARCGEALCGRIVGQPQPRNPDGSLPVDIHGVPHCDLTILHDATETEPGRWRGRITDPETGQDWRCELSIAADGALRLRGYLLVPLLGQTQIWPPFQGSVKKDCTIG